MRPAGHERGAWAAVAAEPRALVYRATMLGSFKSGHAFGLAFRAAEIVYDLEQRLLEAQREHESLIRLVLR